MLLTNNYFSLSICLVLITLAESHQNRYMIVKQKSKGHHKKQQIVLGNVLSDYKMKAIYERKLECTLDCEKNEHCLIDEDLEEQSCVCDVGFLPNKDGIGCHPPPMCNNNDRNFVQCLIYDDTSYTAFDSTDFPPFANASNTNCHWMVSSDSCDGSESKYRVNVRTGIIDDKVIVNNVVIRYLKNMYVIGDDLKVNGKVETLPYMNAEDNFSVESKSGLFIVKNSEFNVRFLKDSILNYGTCDETSCGICGRFIGDEFSRTAGEKFMIHEGGSCSSQFNHIMKDEV